jgi:hypothetical protein
VAEVDVPNVRENPPVANLEDFSEMIIIDCRRFGPLPPTSQYNRRGLGFRGLALRKRISHKRSEHTQNERKCPDHYFLTQNFYRGKKAGAILSPAFPAAELSGHAGVRARLRVGSPKSDLLAGASLANSKFRHAARSPLEMFVASRYDCKVTIGGPLYETVRSNVAPNTACRCCPCVGAFLVRGQI